MKLNDQPHIDQLRSRIIKNKGNNMGRVENMGVVNQKNKKTWKKNKQGANAKHKSEETQKDV